ncbi:hypothetical protein DDZ13_11150 [Coraliomargarita sinensis]|uniref:3-keto-disaccharide hydrolase domain-containing protein n=1 Tax=Coraliomargarita sinensis TaxID=2174842 RepID=A0A317ZF98_9BACT|nr:hypothetical protein [Coraliomargarita sinensis]PXA03532.1 hypothetical protein DDZ13_11150 [Coraliomargarita sinensis]
MQFLPISLVCLGALLLMACQTQKAGLHEKPKPDAHILFEDSMADNWEENWFLDGKRATLEHREGGLAFITTTSVVDKRVDRLPFDAHHAILWTRQEFEGDIRITYTYTRLPGCSWQKLIYVQAQGIGENPYVEDIYAWRRLRDIASMDKYFKYMDLIALSLRDQIRCKRYPWMDMNGNDLDNEFKPRGENKGLPDGLPLDVVVEKREKSIMLRITDTVTGEPVVDHTWDLTDEQVNKNREPVYIDKGRIGMRQMGGHKMLLRNFKVERL